jgi:hypothetical protein
LAFAEPNLKLSDAQPFFCVKIQILIWTSVTLNMSEDLMQLGISSTNMVLNQPLIDASQLLTQAVTYANQHQISNVVADPGTIGEVSGTR